MAQDTDLALVERLTGEALGKTVEIGGVTYGTRALHDVRESEREPKPLGLHTLSSLVEYVKSPHDENYLMNRDGFIHVVGPTEVALRTGIFGDFNQRASLAVVRYEAPIGFSFGQWYDPESFNIGLQSHFGDAADRSTVLALVGNLKTDEVTEFDDDGVTQQATARKGIDMRVRVPVPNPVQLAPFRTFTEVEQPASPFILRLRGGSQAEGKPPSCALFEADGGAWRLEAVRRIQVWLGERLEGALKVFA